MERWRGKVVLVTGASYGIGFSIVEELVKQGLQVIGCARSTKSLDDLESSFKGDGGSLHAIQCDLSQENDILRMFKEIEQRYGHVDILINNAGTATAASFITGKTEEWQKMISLNIVGLSICTREALRLMEKHGVDDGHIININSTAGHDMALTDEHHAYSATKHMVTAITRALDIELKLKKSKIRVTSLSPGHVETPLTVDLKKTYQDRKADFNFLQGKDIADAVVYVLGTPPHVMIRELTIIPTEQSVP